MRLRYFVRPLASTTLAGAAIGALACDDPTPPLTPPNNVDVVLADGVPSGGTWSIASTPNPSQYGNTLFGVSVLSTTNIWAVGARDTYYGTESLIERSQGGAWSVVPSPNPGALNSCGYGNVLSAVSGRAANDIWAVGFQHSCSLYKPFIAHYNGSAWGNVAIANPNPNGYTQLRGVHARTTTDVWAVGTSEASNGAVIPYILRWNGATWTRYTGARPGINSSALWAVAGVSPTDAWAVGTYTDASNRSRTLIERWNGSTWTQVPSPSPGNYLFNVLTSVTAISANDVWAAGYYDSQTTGRETITLHWNGSQWLRIPSPNASSVYGSYNVLNGLVARASNDVWAVGQFRNYPSTNQQWRSFTLRWNGSVWQIVSSPSRPTASGLNAIGGAPGLLVAVGASSPYGNDYNGIFQIPQTFAMRR